MMNAEEDLDIDINLDEDDVQDGGILPELDPSMEQQEPTPAVSTTQVSTRPVPVIPKSMLIPTETNNLLNSPVIDKLDVKISEAGCLSSDSSISGCSVLVSPIVKNNASGLFGDKGDDFPIGETDTNSTTTTETVRPTLIENLSSTLKSTTLKQNESTSPLANTLFSNDKDTDDFLSTPDEIPLTNSINAPQGGIGGSSSFQTSATNYLNQPHTWQPTSSANIPLPFNDINKRFNQTTISQAVPVQPQTIPQPVPPHAPTNPVLNSDLSSPYLYQTNLIANTQNESNSTPMFYNPTDYSKATGVVNAALPAPHMTSSVQNPTFGASPAPPQQQLVNQPNNNPGLNVNHNLNGHAMPNMAASPYGPNLLNSTPSNPMNYLASTQYGAGIHDMANPMNNVQNAPPKKDDGLFIPQMYCSNKSTTPSKFFVPDQVSSSMIPPPAPFVSAPSHVSPPTYDESVYPQANQYNISPLGGHEGNQSEKGILDWLKDRVIKDWPAGAQHIKQYMKTATDSVLTTLDPGMKDYLSNLSLEDVKKQYKSIYENVDRQIRDSNLESGISIAVASQSMAMLIGIKEGFTDALHAVPVVQGHSMNVTESLVLPLGFEKALQMTDDTLEYLSTVRFDIPGKYIMMSAQIFLTELVPGEWYAMYCFGLKDHFKNLRLHTFSQPIPLPVACINASYNQMVQNEAGECLGYNIPIDEVVRRNIPYNKDWCTALSGKSLNQMVATAVQCLALDYQRHVDVITPPPPHQPYQTNTNYSNGNAMNYQQNYSQNSPQSYPTHQPPTQSQYSLSLDAFG